MKEEWREISYLICAQQAHTHIRNSSGYKLVKNSKRKRDRKKDEINKDTIGSHITYEHILFELILQPKV